MACVSHLDVYAASRTWVAAKPCFTGGRADAASGLTAQEHPCQLSAPRGTSSGRRAFAAGPRHTDAHPGRVGGSEVDGKRRLDSRPSGCGRMWWVPPAQVPACADGAAGGGGAGQVQAQAGLRGRQVGLQAPWVMALVQVWVQAGPQAESVVCRRWGGGGATAEQTALFPGEAGERTLSGLVSPCLTGSPDTLASSEPSPAGLRALLMVHPYYSQGKAAQALEKVPDHTQRGLATAGTAASTPNPRPLCLQPHCPGPQPPAPLAAHACDTFTTWRVSCLASRATLQLRGHECWPPCQRPRWDLPTATGSSVPHPHSW